MQRELLACDAEEPLEIWGGGTGTLRYQLVATVIFSFFSSSSYTRLELLGMFTKDNVFMRC